MLVPLHLMILNSLMIITTCLFWQLWHSFHRFYQQLQLSLVMRDFTISGFWAGATFHKYLMDALTWIMSKYALISRQIQLKFNQVWRSIDKIVENLQIFWLIFNNIIFPFSNGSNLFCCEGMITTWTRICWKCKTV